MNKEKQEGLKKLKSHEDGKSSSENSQGKTISEAELDLEGAVKSNDKKKDTKDGKKKKKNIKDSNKGKEKNKKQSTKVSRSLA